MNRSSSAGMVPPRHPFSHAFLWAFLWSSLPLLIGPLAAQPDQTWSLPDAIRFSWEENPDAQLAHERVESARQALLQAQAVAVPHVSIRGGYQQSNMPMLSFGSILNQREFRPGIDFNRPGRIDSLQAGLEANYPLYTGGARDANILAARAGVDAANWQGEGVRRHLALAITETLAHILRNRGLEEAAASSIHTLEQTLAVARQRERAGTLLRADVLALEVELAQSRELLIQTRHQRRLAEIGFQRLLGREPGPLVLAGGLAGLEDLRLPGGQPHSERPELLSLQESLRGAEARIRVARASRKPKVALFASVDHERGWETGGDGTSWTAGLRFQIPVFDGHLGQAREAEAASHLRAHQAEQRRLTLQIAFEREQARLGHEQSLEQVEVASLALSQAEEGARLQRARFEEGLLLSADLIAAENRLTNARMRLATARIQERLAVAQWRYALGLPLLP